MQVVPVDIQNLAQRRALKLMHNPRQTDGAVTNLTVGQGIIHYRFNLLATLRAPIPGIICPGWASVFFLAHALGSWLKEGLWTGGIGLPDVATQFGNPFCQRHNSKYGSIRAELDNCASVCFRKTATNLIENRFACQAGFHAWGMAQLQHDSDSLAKTSITVFN
jgi:hypothetical protein